MSIRTSLITTRPYTQAELIAAAAENDGVIVACLSVPLNVLIEMDGDDGMACYIHEKLIPLSNTAEQFMADFGSMECLVKGHVAGDGNDNEHAPEGEVMIQVTVNVANIISDIEFEQEIDYDAD